MKKFVFSIFILFGCAMGTVIGENLKSSLPWLNYGIDIGLDKPFVLDLFIMNLTFGFGIYINLAGIIGLIVFSIIAIKLIKWA